MYVCMYVRMYVCMHVCVVFGGLDATLTQMSYVSHMYVGVPFKYTFQLYLLSLHIKIFNFTY